MTIRGMRFTTPVLLLVASILVFGSALAVVAVRGGEPTTLVAKEPPNQGDGGVGTMSQPPQDVSCLPGDRRSIGHFDLIDGAGGNLTPATEMSEWLSLNSTLTILDLVAVTPGTNPLFAEYEYRAPLGETIIKFGLNFMGDSWHVTDYEGCSSKLNALTTLFEEPPE